MKFRKRMSRRKSRRVFAKGARRVNRRNFGRVSRGGYRL
jgi:hypothetical protein